MQTRRKNRRRRAVKGNTLTVVPTEDISTSDAAHILVSFSNGSRQNAEQDCTDTAKQSSPCDRKRVSFAFPIVQSTDQSVLGRSNFPSLITSPRSILKVPTATFPASSDPENCNPFPNQEVARPSAVNVPLPNDVFQLDCILKRFCNVSSFLLILLLSSFMCKLHPDREDKFTTTISRVKCPFIVCSLLS